MRLWNSSKRFPMTRTDRIGQELLGVIEGKVADESAYIGRTWRCTKVDGYIFVQTGELLMTGDFAKVRVTGALEYDLIGGWQMNAPNKLTVARMILVPFLVLFMLTGWGGEANRYISLLFSLWPVLQTGLMESLPENIICWQTLVNLWIRLQINCICSAMICFIELDKLPAWIVIIIIGREFIISGFRLITAENSIVIAANCQGKFRQYHQMIMIILLLIDLGGAFDILEQIFIWLSVALTIISLITYIWQNKECAVC